MSAKLEIAAAPPALEASHLGLLVILSVVGGLVDVTMVAAAGEQFLPMLSTREGASGL